MRAAEAMGDELGQITPAAANSDEDGLGPKDTTEVEPIANPVHSRLVLMSALGGSDGDVNVKIVDDSTDRDIHLAIRVGFVPALLTCEWRVVEAATTSRRSYGCAATCGLRA